MITQFRRRLKSRTARSVVLWAILLTLGAGLISTAVLRIFRLDKKIGGGGFGSVNGSDLSVDIFKMKMHENEQRIQMLRKYFGQEADKILKQIDLAADPRTAALQTVVAQELIDQLADRLNIHVASDFIDRKFSDKAFLQNEFGLIDFDQVIDPTTGVIDGQRLGYYLKMLGITGQTFEDVLLGAIKREILTEIAANSTYIPEFELRQKYIKDYLAKRFAVLKFDFNSFVQEAKQKAVTAEDLKRFFDAENSRSKRYWVPESRDGVAYYFDTNSYGINLQESAIARYYDENKTSMFVKEPAKVQVRRILIKNGTESEKTAREIHAKLVANPMGFEGVAEEMSDDKESAKNGGLVPMFSRGQRDAEFEKAAMMLKQDGNISDVIKTKDGFEVLQRVKRQEAIYKPLKEVEGQVREKLILNEFKRVFSSDMNKMMTRGTFDENQLNELIKKSTKTEKIEPKVNGEDEISRALFRVRDGIPAYFVTGGTGVVVVLSSVQNGHFSELGSIQEKVSGDYYDKKASEALNAVIKKVAQQARTKDIGELEKAYGQNYNVAITNTGLIKENDTAKVNELKAKGLPVEKMFKLDILGSTNSFRTDNKENSNGYVVKLEELDKFDESQYLSKKKDLKKELTRSKNMAQLEEFIAFLRKKAIIKISK